MRRQVLLVKVSHLCTTSSKEPGNFALKCGNTTIYLIMARGTSLSVSAENINGIISIMDLVCCTRLGSHKWGLPLSLKLWCPPFKDMRCHDKVENKLYIDKVRKVEFRLVGYLRNTCLKSNCWFIHSKWPLCWSRNHFYDGVKLTNSYLTLINELWSFIKSWIRLFISWRYDTRW